MHATQTHQHHYHAPTHGYTMASPPWSGQVDEQHQNSSGSRMLAPPQNMGYSPPYYSGNSSSSSSYYSPHGSGNLDYSSNAQIQSSYPQRTPRVVKEEPYDAQYESVLHGGYDYSSHSSYGDETTTSSPVDYPSPSSTPYLMSSHHQQQQQQQHSPQSSYPSTPLLPPIQEDNHHRSSSSYGYQQQQQQTQQQVSDLSSIFGNGSSSRGSSHSRRSSSASMHNRDGSIVKRSSSHSSSRSLPSRISTALPSTSSIRGVGSSPSTSPSGERFTCYECGKTFSRAHDRKRHHETQHVPDPTVHECPYCHKEFSRNDSLRRHLNTRCDDAPSNLDIVSRR